MPISNRTVVTWTLCVVGATLGAGCIDPPPAPTVSPTIDVPELDMSSSVIDPDMKDEEPVEDMAEPALADMPPALDLSDSPDMRALDMSSAPPDMSPPIEDMNVCTPTVVCDPVGACGSVDNGCGEVLDCGPCACVGDVVNIPTCGACRLGKVRCDGGNPTCDIPPALSDPGEINCADVVYVDVDAIIDPMSPPDGSKSNPYANISNALGAANARVLVLQAKTYEASQLDLSRDSSIFGGFDDDWVFDESGRSEILLTGGGADSTRREGIIAHDPPGKIWLERLDVKMVEPEANDYVRYVAAMRFSGGAEVYLTHVSATSASGPNGPDGGSGTKGIDGMPGGDAGRKSDRDSPAPDRGQPVAQVDCAGIFGGVGGLGGVPGAGDGERGADSQRSMAGALGGLGGEGSTDKSDRRGENGAQGAEGAAGQPGVRGTTSSSFTVDGWVHDGGDGTDGTPGSPGVGGGGGGGGGRLEAIIYEYAGGSGGAGGNGGCGGTGGIHGVHGGSSIAMLVIDSSVYGTNVILAAGDGGAGGASGIGGDGGFGGDGGRGTYKRQSGLLEEDHKSGGGDGGRGGDGGAGGYGGPGAGGFSVGVMCSAPGLIRPDASWQFASGSAGAGGEIFGVAGASPASDGLAAEQLGCEPR